MEPIQKAAIARASAALRIATDNTTELARAFVEGAKAIALTDERWQVLDALRACGNPLVQRAAQAPNVLSDSAWGRGDAAALAAAYIGSIAEQSLLDQIMVGARVIPDAARVLVAAGFAASNTGEASLKAVKHLSLAGEQGDPTKVAAICVVSDELLRAGGDAVDRLFEAEMTQAIVRATNRSILAGVASLTTTSVDATGDALADLRAGLAKAQPSESYVVAVPTGVALDLATRVEGGGMGVRGGLFRPGIFVVAVDSQDAMTIIPTSRLAVRDFGLTVRRSAEALVEMSDEPDGTGEAVSLWQSNLRAVLVERTYRLIPGNTAIVEVG